MPTASFSIVDAIYANAQWVFSGVGVLILTGAWRLFSRKKLSFPIADKITASKVGINVQAGTSLQGVTINQGLQLSDLEQLTRTIAAENSPSLKVDAASLLAKIQSRTTSLASCVVEALALAGRLGDEALSQFCTNELSGWSSVNIRTDDPPRHRSVDSYLAIQARINLDTPLWNRSSEKAYQYMASNPHMFKPVSYTVGTPLSKLEADQNLDYSDKMISVSGKIGEFFQNMPNPEMEVVIYLHPRSYQKIVEEVRADLTRRLLKYVEV